MTTSLSVTRRSLLAVSSLALGLPATALARKHSNPPPVAHPNPLRTLRVIGFAGGFNLPIWAAERQGYFDAEGLRVDLHFTPNSKYQITQLLAGNYDIAMTAVDNVVAYQEGQSEAPIGPNPDLFAFFGSDGAFLSLVSQRPYKRIEDLHGKTLTVDAMTTGFAFVLREILARNGITENEVRFEQAGSVASRFRAMTENPDHAATMQMTPFEVLGEERGFNTLVRAEDVIGEYVGMCGVTRRRWAAANESAVIGYTRAYSRGVDWLIDPANRPLVEALLVARVPALTPALAPRVADLLLAERGGFHRDLSISEAGVRTVLKLRSRYGLPKRELTDPGRYVDDRYRRAALAGRGA
ncbi:MULTISPECIES: ABC transporter substrate-binding protein [unclassified Variovorax]|uniref:ABC transporter substrate-binding protein n=1 Tax=unclassified Variovorax TaxID=663243 RepID=UPI003F467910